MKTKLIIGILSASVLFFTSCLKADHSLRVKNSYSQPFTNVTVDGTSYGPISVGGTTDYKPLEEGDFTISGTTTTGSQLSGSGKVTGKGKHKWTMTITAAGGVSIVKD